MSTASQIAQYFFLLAALVVAAWLTIRSRSVLVGGLCLYGLFVLQIVLLSIIVPSLLVVLQFDDYEVNEAFPGESSIVPVVLLYWIPAFVFAALVHLVHAALTGTLDSSPLWASRHWFVELARRLHLLPGDASAHPGKGVTYPKWVGVILGFLLIGSAHFLSGRRRAGIAWYLSLLALGVLATYLIAVRGIRPFVAGMAVAAVAFLLWLVMLKRSYRSVGRIGVLGWLAVIASNLSLQEAERWSARFFVEAFRTSSQSMSPTLESVHARDVADGEPFRPGLMARLVRGERHMEWRASASGPLNGPFYPGDRWPGYDGYSVGKDMHRLPRRATPRFEKGQRVDRGALVWSGLVVTSDRVIAEKVSYFFREPRRGEIVVFKARDPGRWGKDEYHMFRVVGLPGERVQIESPGLLVNGERLVDPPIFATIAAKQQGYAGFSLPHPAGKGVLGPSGEIVLGDGEYFVLGDGGDAYDSRYCGPVHRKDIVGPSHSDLLATQPSQCFGWKMVIRKNL